MKLLVTIFEETPEAAIAAIRALDARHDGVEVRFDAFGDRPYDFAAFRAATTKPILATNRGAGHVDVEAAIAAGIDLVDVEWHPGIAIEAHRDRIVLSHHDWEGMPDLAPLVASMKSIGCAHVKIAVTPSTLHDNEHLLRALPSVLPGTLPSVAAAASAAPRGTGGALSIFGMGERGLYSRILAPFFGSELTFVAPDDTRTAAPGQLSLERALAIYGDGVLPHDSKIFAIAGNPAGHSLSPTIHNPLFRQHSLAAAYTIASFETFDEIAEAFLAGRITGLSVTAPFKEEAFALAKRERAEIRENALASGSVNTLVRVGARIVADNTDVDGFETLLTSPSVAAGAPPASAGEGGNREVAIIGAGGTARAAQVALERHGYAVTVYNRTAGKLGAQPLDDLASFRGALIVNTLPGGVDVALPPGIRVIDAAYNKEGGTGLQLLHAQALRQNELFTEAVSS